MLLKYPIKTKSVLEIENFKSNICISYVLFLRIISEIILVDLVLIYKILMPWYGTNTNTNVILHTFSNLMKFKKKKHGITLHVF